jgi:hypothetical protein
VRGLALVALVLVFGHLVDLQAQQVEQRHPLPALASTLYPLPD